MCVCMRFDEIYDIRRTEATAKGYLSFAVFLFVFFFSFVSRKELIDNWNCSVYIGLLSFSSRYCYSER